MLSCLQAGTAAVFIPFGQKKDHSTSESHTGLWFCPTHNDVAAMKTMLMPTTDSVTGGVALKMIMAPGSQGVLTREQGSFPPSAGITLYAKASRNIEIQIGKATRPVGTDWNKIDFTWEAMGTTAENRNLGWQWVLKVKTPPGQKNQSEKTWLIVDRIGVESPVFIAKPEINIQEEKEVKLSSESIIYGQRHIQETIDAMQARKPLTLLVLGDSVTAGAQAARGNWEVKNVIPFLYFNRLADQLRQTFDVQITVKDFGHGGWTAEKALTVIDSEIVANAKAGDLVLLEFGANDLSWAKTPHESYKENFRKLIKRVKTKTSQIVLLGPTMFEGLEEQASAVTQVLKELCEEESVAAVDITQIFVHQGPAFAWAWLANSCHPDFCGHAVLGRMMAPLFTSEHVLYPFE